MSENPRKEKEQKISKAFEWSRKERAEGGIRF